MFFLAMQQPVTKRHLCFFGSLTTKQMHFFHYKYKCQSIYVWGYCGFRSLLCARSRPGFQHAMLLLSVKGVQLVQVSPQLEHPCCLVITPLLTIISHNHKVIIVLSLDRCTMLFRKGCIFKSNFAFCTEIKSSYNYS